MRLPRPVPVASHSAVVAASTAAGTAMRAEAKKAGSMAGIWASSSRCQRGAA